MALVILYLLWSCKKFFALFKLSLSSSHELFFGLGSEFLESYDLLFSVFVPSYVVSCEICYSDCKMCILWLIRICLAASYCLAYVSLFLALCVDVKSCDFFVL
ncbi:hypothetical protein HanHA300_Chr15g0581571 [Helianthus annuus]|nr:hypothetical protein HanHA300_Chr15g0581571 [Helianthus annuus]